MDFKRRGQIRAFVDNREVLAKMFDVRKGPPYSRPMPDHCSVAEGRTVNVLLAPPVSVSMMSFVEIGLLSRGQRT